MHHELPQRLDLEWYRKAAKELLRAARAGDAGSRQRVRDAIGVREPLRLADAQRVLAVEHGFRGWPEFGRWVATREPEPPVGRIGRRPVEHYEEQARALAKAAGRGEDGAVRRVRAHVPRLAGFDGGELPLRDARIAIAHEFGFPTWHELVVHVEAARRDHEGQREGDDEVLAALDAIRTGDIVSLTALLDRAPRLVGRVHNGAWTTLLEAIAQPDVVGEGLELELGVDPRVVELLAERGAELEEALGLAACFNRAELVRLLLSLGARGLRSEIWGITPLQAAVYHGSREAADALVAAVGLDPDALYIAASVGDTRRVDDWFDESGALRADAFRERPNLADVGWGPAPPPRDDAQEVLDEAFALAAYNGRIETMEQLHDLGADVDGKAHGLTAQRFAEIRNRVDVLRYLAGLTAAQS